MAGPGTDWREVVQPGEQERFEAFGRAFAALQERKSARFGWGRALHRKTLTGVRAELEVAAGLPEHAAQGVFATPGVRQASIRLSNAGVDVAPDKVPDIRGLAIKVHDVRGPGALGFDTDCHDWLMINHERFAFVQASEFAELVIAAGKGGLWPLIHVVRRYGFGALRVLGELNAIATKPFSGFATEAFHTVLPSAMGPYAARVRLTPIGQTPAANARNDWAADVAARLRDGPITWDVEVQHFVDEASTPIEDAKHGWADAPWLRVGKLTASQQDLLSPEGRAFSAEVNEMTFDPWHALATNRPLGEVMRARKVVYFATQQARKRPAAIAGT